MPPQRDDEVDEDDVVWLLHLASRAASLSAPLSDRRRLVLESVGERVGADAGWWAWGQGHPKRSTVTPLALIHFGFTGPQLALHIEAGLHPEMDEILREPVLKHLENAPQHTAISRQLIPDARWRASQIFQRFYAPSGHDQFLHSVRYFDRDYWSNCALVRNSGRETFEERECRILDRTMAGIQCMHIAAEEAIPPGDLAALTPRQRTVLLMLLDGQSRKHIAYRLGISAHTVNEHVKQLYTRFQVNSVGELGARFLQSHA
jgi:DNA-binding CsgD family transcriptional regulator